jgi:hypothetical protein
MTEREFDAYLGRYAMRTIPLYDWAWAQRSFAEMIARARGG